MTQAYSWEWVEAQVARTVEVWNGSAAGPEPRVPQYCLEQQRQREKEYDEAVQAVEREAKKSPRTRAGRLKAQERITQLFARFSAAALDLNDDATQLLTDDFLPVGTKLARWARQFDPGLSMADIIQANRNAWTACGLQPLLGESVKLTPAILGYSLLYPYTDNYLDRLDVSADEKHRFSERFRQRLGGGNLAVENDRDAALWALVELIEEQYPRERFPQVFDCLLAIHRAQEESIAQLNTGVDHSDAEVLHISCAKGGTSVLADACLARGGISGEESRFSFEWGVLLQLGDDLQDLREDLRRGSVTLFSRAAAAATPLDNLTTQLLRFSEQVGARMDDLTCGSGMLKDLLRMSWQSLIVGAVADSHEFFSPGFLRATEQSSPFSFEFLRTRRKRLASREGLYATLFEAFLEAPEYGDLELPLSTPFKQRRDMFDGEQPR
jgi:hypothetical protein